MKPEYTIYHAESARIDGPTYKDLRIARERGNISSADLATVDLPVLRELAPWWRIQVNLAHSLSQRELSGNKAAEWLQEARSVIKVRYLDPRVRELVPQITEDDRGNEYWMATEMARDIGKYYLYVAALTGNATFLNLALVAFTDAMAKSDQETSANDTASLEAGALIRRLTGRTNPEYMKSALERIVHDSDNSDRIAAMSKLYLYETLYARNLDEAKEAYQQMTVALRADNRSAVKYLAKDAARVTVQWAQRWQGRRIDPQQFVLETNSPY